MFCLWCCEYGNLSNALSSFVTGGCTNLKINTLRSHDISSGHDNVVKAHRAQKNPAAAPLARAVRIVSEEVQNKLKTLFEIAYFVAKLELPFTTYENLCGLEIKHGVDLGQTYRNDKACKNFVLTISENVKCDLTELLTSCRFIGVMADDVTDVGTREVEDVYVRFLENGEASNKFVGLKECPNAKAPGVLQAIEEAVKGVDQNWKQKTVGLGSDGASVMVGKNSGGVCSS